MSDWLFALPTWLVLVLVAAPVLGLFAALVLTVAAARGDAREQRAKRAHVEFVERRPGVGDVRVRPSAGGFRRGRGGL